MLQEVICSPDDVLGTDTERDRDGGVVRLARTVSALAAHATPTATAQCSPNDIQTDQHSIPTPTTDTDIQHLTIDTTGYDDNEIELDYRNQLSIYSDECYMNNFTGHTIDEAEEYLINHTDEQEAQYAPVYAANETRNRGAYYQTNKVQFVTPFCKKGGGGILENDDIEIYDTDEIDFAVDESREEIIDRYDRGKMNLEIRNNLNAGLRDGTEITTQDDRDRFFYTCLCLGTFFVSAIVLILYPL